MFFCLNTPPKDNILILIHILKNNKFCGSLSDSIRGSILKQLNIYLETTYCKSLCT